MLDFKYSVKRFADFHYSYTNLNDFSTLARHCQHFFNKFLTKLKYYKQKNMELKPKNKNNEKSLVN